MRPDDFELLYRQLREALELAYRRKPWAAACIDCIAQDLASLERSLAVEQGQSVHPAPSTAQPAPQQPPRTAVGICPHRPAPSPDSGRFTPGLGSEQG